MVFFSMLMLLLLKKDDYQGSGQPYWIIGFVCLAGCSTKTGNVMKAVNIHKDNIHFFMTYTSCLDL